MVDKFETRIVFVRFFFILLPCARNTIDFMSTRFDYRSNRYKEVSFIFYNNNNNNIPLHFLEIR